MKNIGLHMDSPSIADTRKTKEVLQSTINSMTSTVAKIINSKEGVVGKLSDPDDRSTKSDISTAVKKRKRKSIIVSNEGAGVGSFVGVPPEHNKLLKHEISRGSEPPKKN